MGRPHKTEAQFWAKGTPEPNTGCLLWTEETLSESGFPRVRWNGRGHPASHVAMLLDGRPKPDGLEALHSCDQPLCFSPAHLSWGTHAKNIAQRSERGRQARGLQITANRNTARGERSGMCKLSDVLVEIIRAVYADGVFTQTQLANWFGVGQSQLQRIVRHQSRT